MFSAKEFKQTDLSELSCICTVKPHHYDYCEIKTIPGLRPPFHCLILQICTIFHLEIKTTPSLRPLLSSPNVPLSMKVNIRAKLFLAQWIGS
jgi:hypothetical protein